MEVKYFVNTSKCRIPYVDPFNAEGMKIYKPRKYVKCSYEDNLITVSYDKYLEQYLFHINYDMAHQLANKTEQIIKCFYRRIVYGANPDYFESASPFIYFSQNYPIPLHVEAVCVKCFGTLETDVLQMDAFTFIQYQSLPKSFKGGRKPSVIMYGIGSISRINLRRTMPLVYEFLKGRGWYEMKGYNKIGDKSFLNILALLSGHSVETGKDICDTDIKGCLDEFPFIWKDFKIAEYLTAYAEDNINSNIFNNLKPGFMKKPTDYYFRPFLTAFEYILNNTRCRNCSKKYCLGRRLANSYISDYCRQFMQRFVAERPIWGMFSTNQITHDDVFMASGMQHRIVNDLLNYEKDGVFENTILILFSTHGAQSGPLMKLEEGFLEQQLPMMFIYLPPWFRKTYPQYAQALDENQNRLSSNYDIYNTLNHIIEIGNGIIATSSQSKSPACPLCKSLFFPLPQTRSCSDAGIPEEYCTCHSYRSIERSWSWQISEGIVNELSAYLKKHNLNNICKDLTLKNVYKTEMKVDFYKENPPLEPHTNYYHVRFDINEGNAMFYATALFNNITKKVMVHVPYISRINQYEKHSSCINHKLHKLFCICLRQNA